MSASQTPAPSPRASELLLQSALPFDTACMMVKEMEVALVRLMALKKYEKYYGRDEHFENELKAVFELSDHIMQGKL